MQVVSLDDEQIQSALESAGLKADRPTLVRLGSPMRAWQGPVLAWKLVRLLGVPSAVRVLTLLGVQVDPDRVKSAPVSRRVLLARGGKFALGALFVGGSVAATSTAAAAASNPARARRLLGRDLDNAVASAMATEPVRRIVEELARKKYEGGDRLSSSAVAADDGAGTTIVWLSMWHPDTSTLALVAASTDAHRAPRVAFLHLAADGAHPAGGAPAATSEVIRPALDWGCLGQCAAEVCPWCLAGCAVAGPFWAQCVVDCCGVAVIICYNISC